MKAKTQRVPIIRKPKEESIVLMHQGNSASLDPAIINAAKRVGYTIVPAAVPGTYDLLNAKGHVAAAGVSLYNLELAVVEWARQPA